MDSVKCRRRKVFREKEKKKKRIKEMKAGELIGGVKVEARQQIRALGRENGRRRGRREQQNVSVVRGGWGEEVSRGKVKERDKTKDKRDGWRGEGQRAEEDEWDRLGKEGVET